jgi:hypothetical protein
MATNALCLLAAACAALLAPPNAAGLQAPLQAIPPSTVSTPPAPPDTSSSAATTTPPGVARAIRAQPAAPRVDGRLDDPAWAIAPAYSGFVQREPHEGRPSVERTEFRVVYTDEALYVGVRAYDSHPDAIVGQLTRRDQNSPSDEIIVTIDSYRDRRTAFDFWVNPVGVKVDLYRSNDTDEDQSWDAVWDVATTRDEGGWTAEYRIPFSQLRFPRAEQLTFGFNVCRQVLRLNELACWMPLPRSASGIVSLFGDLEGLEGIRPPRRLEILPYSVGRTARTVAEEGNPFRTGEEYGARAGTDVKVGIGSNLTLDATVNPDFGQVEADPAVLNLTAFETYFSERRPFFTEGVNIFRFPLSLGDGDGANEQLFYSRRVGRAPQGSADVPAGGYGENIQQTTILAAGKLSGRLPSGWTIGLLGARTSEESARTEDSLGVRSTQVVEPASNYFVGRLARDFRNGRTMIGLFGTAMNRELPQSLDWLRSSAYSLGLDWSHRFRRDTYQFRGRLVGTRVLGSEAAMLRTQRSSARYFQRPDRDYGSALDSTATSLNGYAGLAEFGKIGGGRWRFLTALELRSPGFEPNDAGYMRDVDQTTHVMWVGYREFRPGRVFQNYGINLNYWNAWDFGWDRYQTSGNINGNFTFRNYWGGYFGFEVSRGGHSNATLRGGPSFLRQSRVGGWGGFSSDERKRLRGEFNSSWGTTEGTGGWYLDLSPYLTWRPSGRMELSAGPGVNWNVDDAQWLGSATALGATRYLFGRLHQRTISATIRGNVTFTPTLSLQIWAQPFVTQGHYADVKQVADSRAARYADRFDVFGSDRLTRDSDGNIAIDLDRNGSSDIDLGNPEFGYMAFRSNVVLRWEYRPGSTLFLVWQQSREDFGTDGTFRSGGAFRDLTRTRPENVFLVKLNYWFSL